MGAEDLGRRFTISIFERPSVATCPEHHLGGVAQLSLLCGFPGKTVMSMG
jgi:hypothetical protein